jgi:two-component system, cell cycle response regulator
MPSSHQVALLGFSNFERSTLESCFRLSQQRAQSYALAGSIEGSELLIADCDKADVLQLVNNSGRIHDTLFVGGQLPPGSAGAHLPRPIDALAVQRTLDSLLARRAFNTWPAALERRSGHTSLRARMGMSLARRQQDFHSTVGMDSVATHDAASERHVLVVSPSPAEQQLLCAALEPLGYSAVCCNNGPSAIQLVEQSRFTFVFLGMALGSGIAFHTCREIKQLTTTASLADNSNSPAVVMMARTGSATDRARATVSGCDAFLSEPIDPEELHAILARHDQTFERSFVPTVSPAL